jgi:hypothetical protein
MFGSFGIALRDRECGAFAMVQTLPCHPIEPSLGRSKSADNFRYSEIRENSTWHKRKITSAMLGLDLDGFLVDLKAH